MTAAHVAFHIIRWVIRDDVQLIYQTAVGVSGAIATVVLIPICVLMKLPECLRERFSWELRKRAHMLCVVFGVALCWHTSRMFWFMGLVICVYTADKFFTLYAKT